jgi:hypothetical protein
LFEQQSISILLSQPGRRTTIHQIGLNILVMLEERTEAGL